MLRRPMPRLLSAAAVTGAACALSASALAAAPAATALAAAAAPRPAGHWSGPEGPLPRAFTSAAAALAPVSFPGSASRGLLAAWKGQLSGRVFYETRLSAAGHWSARASIPLARTNRAPSVASYTDPDGRPAEVAVWKGRGNRRIWYSQGETARNGTISWTVPQSLPRTVRDRTRSAPAVFFPFDTYVAVVAWKGPLHHVRYAIGTPGRPAGSGGRRRIAFRARAPGPLPRSPKCKAARPTAPCTCCGAGSGRTGSASRPRRIRSPWPAA